MPSGILPEGHWAGHGSAEACTAARHPPARPTIKRQTNDQFERIGIRQCSVRHAAGIQYIGERSRLQQAFIDWQL